MRYTERNFKDKLALVKRYTVEGRTYRDSEEIKLQDKDLCCALSKLYDLEESEEKLGVDLNCLLDALINGFFFFPAKDKDISGLQKKAYKNGNISDKYHDRMYCYSKDSTTLENDNKFFQKIGYNGKPLPLYKVYLSADELSLVVYIWTVNNGYVFYENYLLEDYGNTWALNKNELGLE